LPLEEGVDIEGMLDNPGYMACVLDTAEERQRCGKRCPTLLIGAGALSGVETDRLRSRRNLALLFGAEAVLFQDTVQAFHLDAVRWSFRSRKEPLILGVHQEWLEPGGRTRRVLMASSEGLVRDVRLSLPLTLDSALVLHLKSRGEQETHRALSRWCRNNGVIELNPYPAAAIADGKAQTLEAIKESQTSVELPRFCLISRTDPAHVVRRKLSSFWMTGSDHVYLAPNSGTEGRGVVRKALASAEDINELAGSVRRGLDEDDVLLREERGNVRALLPEEIRRGYRRIVFKILVAHRGDCFSADSGYALLAPDEKTEVVSCSHRGKIMPLNLALRRLYHYHNGGWRPIRLGGRALERMKKTACSAAWAINRGTEGEPLRFMSVDIVWEVPGEDTGTASWDSACGGDAPDQAAEKAPLAPVFLEANPRPSGLASAGEIGSGHACTVSLALFDGLQALLAG
jgi:hypothetical protein